MRRIEFFDNILRNNVVNYERKLPAPPPTFVAYKELNHFNIIIMLTFCLCLSFFLFPMVAIHLLSFELFLLLYVVCPWLMRVGVLIMPGFPGKTIKAGD